MAADWERSFFLFIRIRGKKHIIFLLAADEFFTNKIRDLKIPDPFHIQLLINVAGSIWGWLLVFDILVMDFQHTGTGSEVFIGKAKDLSCMQAAEQGKKEFQTVRAGTAVYRIQKNFKLFAGIE